MFKERASGATLVVSIGATSLSLGVVHRGTLSGEVSAELAPERRPKEQAVSGVMRLLAEKAPGTLANFASSAKGAHITRIFAVIRPPLSESHIVSAERLFESDRTVSDSILDECAREALGGSAEQPGFLSAVMLQARLNGYPTSRPEGKRAASVQLVGLVSTAEREVKEQLHAECSALLPAAEATIRSGTAAIIAATERATDMPRDALVVRLSQEGTDLVIIRDGIPDACAFLPLGMQHIANLAFPEQPPETLYSALRLSIRGDSSETAAARADEALVRSEPDLAKSFGEAFASLSAASRLPDRVLLIAPREASEWFSRFLSRIDFAPFTFAAQPFQTAPLPLALENAMQPTSQDLALALLLYQKESALRS